MSEFIASNKVMACGELGLKVWQELGELLANPSQLANPQRLKELISRGCHRVRAINAISDASVTERTTSVFATLESVSDEDNKLRFVYSPPTPLLGVVFPDNCRVRYSTPDTRASVENMVVIGSTVSGKGHYSTEGHIDHEGVKQPLAIRATEDQPQHGGLLYRDHERRLEVLNYESLMQEAPRVLSPSDVLMQTLWYMDSGNQDLVANRDNLNNPNTYNGLGCFNYLNGRRNYFAVINEPNSIFNLKKHFNLKRLWLDSRCATAKEVAAFCNAVALDCKAQSWDFAGLELSGGGAYWLPDYSGFVLAQRDYFVMDY